MSLVRIGGEIHHQRRQAGLPHEQVGTLAGLSRVTVNQLENGTLKDLGYTKLTSAMDIPDLNMENVQSKGLKSALNIAARSVGTSYRDVMTPELLATILRSGVAADRIQPHLMALLDDTPLLVVVKAVAEAATPEVPAKKIMRRLSLRAQQWQLCITVW